MRSVHIYIPTDWNAEQALWAAEVLFKLESALWNQYGDAIAFLLDQDDESDASQEPPEPPRTAVGSHTDDDIPF